MIIITGKHDAVRHVSSLGRNFAKLDIGIGHHRLWSIAASCMQH